MDALLEAGCAVITIFGKTWDFHVAEALGTTLAENARMIADSVAYLKAAGRTVVFDAEHFFDGWKENPGYARECLAAAADAGADFLVLCDTNGGALPFEVEEATARVREAFRTPIGIHAHNDGGCAVANSLAAVRAGATMVQGTVNGYGERCGNADLCTLIPDLVFKMDALVACRENLPELRALSHFVAEVVNLIPDAHQPYVGANAFAHKGGAHVHAVARRTRLYEHVDPAAVGNASRVLVSEIAGKSAIARKAAAMGLDEAAVAGKADEIVARLKELEHAGWQFEAADGSFELLVRDVLHAREEFFEFESFRVIVEKQAETGEMVSEATVRIRKDGARILTTAEGNGPVHALDAALRKALRRFYPQIDRVLLSDFKVRVLDETHGTGAVTRVLIESTDGDRSWGTVGVSENVIEASWQALVDGILFGLLHVTA
jgi:2-isopropylmalate synthase